MSNESSSASLVTYYLGESGKHYYDYQSRAASLLVSQVATRLSSSIQPADAVLDFGCGNGLILRALKCKQRFGVEINAAAREAAIRNGVTCFDSLEQVQNGTMDVVISHHSLEHVGSPLVTLREINQKLRAGGTLLLTVPIDDWRSQLHYNPADRDHHLYTWTPHLLGTLLDEAGFVTSTLRTKVGVNGYFSAFPLVATHLPALISALLLQLWSRVRRRREVQVIIKTPSGAHAV